MTAVIQAAEQAFDVSGLTPQDLEVAELHNCFTIAELIEMEDIGFCERGAARELINDGATEIEGEIPVNPSGELKARGHPVGAIGIA